MLLNDTCEYEKTPQLLFKKIFLKNIFVRKFYNSEKKERERKKTILNAVLKLLKNHQVIQQTKKNKTLRQKHHSPFRG